MKPCTKRWPKFPKKGKGYSGARPAIVKYRENIKYREYG